MTEATVDWQSLVLMAQSCSGFTDMLKLDRVLRKYYGTEPPEGLSSKPITLAMLGSASVEHLLAGLRVGALKRGLWLSTYTPAYGQYLQELFSPDSSLHTFKPNTTLFAFDVFHLFGIAMGISPEAQLEAACDKIRNAWHLAHKNFGGHIIQQTVVPQFPPLIGNNEHRLPGSLYWLTHRVNERLRSMADEEGVDLLAIDGRIMIDGLSNWFNPILWHMAKQDISPAVSPIYGDLAAHLIAARQGRSYKCLVLDLDNTLWGGVIGDDGLEGIVLGQGNAQGEAYLAMQRYVKALSERGVILAVCSKNDEANALLPFEQHPEMILKRSDIACFIANWQDKATNLREIAHQLNIGLDSLVFVDDSLYERNLVRRELSMVAVPELPESPSQYPYFIAEQGYFEALNITPEDRERSKQYQANLKREALKLSITNMDDYLRSLEMELRWQVFHRTDLQRVVQLINKTNQFNLTTRRYGEDEVLALMTDPQSLTLQLRLIDRFGDNGIIGIVIGRSIGNGDMMIDTWLMSCRVLGRTVEQATLNLVVSEARCLGIQRLIGEYRPTDKNSMVREHYSNLGFIPMETAREDGRTQWTLLLGDFQAYNTFIAVKDTTDER